MVTAVATEDNARHQARVGRSLSGHMCASSLGLCCVASACLLSASDERKPCPLGPCSRPSGPAGVPGVAEQSPAPPWHPYPAHHRPCTHTSHHRCPGDSLGPSLKLMMFFSRFSSLIDNGLFGHWVFSHDFLKIWVSKTRQVIHKFVCV